MKIGIATIVDYKNYGNRLQNYALQEALKTMEFDVETIVNHPYKPDENKSVIIRYMERMKELGLKGNIDRVSEKVKGDPKEKLLNEKKRKFKEFSTSYINETGFTVDPKNVPATLKNQFDFFVTGSDQVWNPTYRKGSSFDFLTFAPSDKRVSYAPSFGVSTIPDNYKEEYKTWLSEFSSLSVREDAGAQLIDSLTGRKAPVLVDPTLLLTKEEWLKFAKPSESKPKKEYLLTYYLGKLSQDKQKLINEVAQENNLQIVNLADYNDPAFYTITPDEFVDMINNATVFFTDSFHGAVFSILLEKPFVVFERESKVPSMNSRIDTLLTKFDLLDRKFELINKDNLFDINYSHVPPILKKERNKSLDYLTQAFHKEEAN